MSLKTSKPFLQLKKAYSGLSGRDRYALVYDVDPDGLSSAVIAARVLTRKTGRKPAVVFPYIHGKTKLDGRFLRSLKAKKVGYCFFFDISIDQFPKELRRLSRQANVIVFDHHKIYNTFHRNGIIIIKPQLVQKRIIPSQYCTSKLTYDVLNLIQPIPELAWIASLGIIGDSAFRTWKGFLNRVMGGRILKNGEEIFNTELGKATQLVSYMMIADPKKHRRLFNILLNSSSVRQLLKSEIGQYGHVAREINSYLRQYKAKAEFHKKFIFYSIRPIYMIGSILSTLIGNLNPNKTVIIVQPMDRKMFRISARRLDYKVRVNSVLENVIGRLPFSSAGGHVPAAGGTIRKKDYRKFVKRLKDALK